MGRIDREDALVLAVDAHDDLVVGIGSTTVPLRHAHQDWTVRMDLAIEVSELALDDEGLQTLLSGEIAERSRLDASVRRRWLGRDDTVTRDHSLPVAEYHGQRGGTAVFVGGLTHGRYALDELPAGVACEVSESCISGRAQIAAARAKCEERGARSNRVGVQWKLVDEDNDEHDGENDECAGPDPNPATAALEVGQLGSGCLARGIVGRGR